MRLFIPLGIVLAASVLTLASISSSFLIAQLVWIVLGLALIVALYFIDWRGLISSPRIVGAVYALAILLLGAVLVIGPVVRNIRGWIVIGPFSYQPVELAKLALILLFAQYFSRAHVRIARYSTMAWSFCMAALPAALTMLQPDLGSAVILFALWFGLLIVSGLPWRRIMLALALAALAALVMWFLILAPYQKARIIGVIYPQQNTLGINYSTNQARIAIGSAGLFGKGYRQGSQTQLGFLSEPQSDFVLASFVEEWGWGGGLVLLAAFLFLLFAILRTGMRAGSNTEKFICLGAALLFLLQFAINAGSTVGLLPVVGVTFPFLSYGGSSLLTNMALIAIVNAIGRRS
jgi:rod shape determining protein RodA